VSWLEKRGKILHLLTVVKLGDGWERCRSAYGIPPNFWCTCVAALGSENSVKNKGEHQHLSIPTMSGG